MTGEPGESDFLLLQIFEESVNIDQDVILTLEFEFLDALEAGHAVGHDFCFTTICVCFQLAERVADGYHFSLLRRAEHSSWYAAGNGRYATRETKLRTMKVNYVRPSSIK